ncbi:hypothetical protein CCR75_004591 [Bremia lactucae]|uniref:Uncharacterized protein n=1 Tax=Bremia lactucae TaxID=4779 RepID=A0A976IDU8_BRELC|nr:hypothetical protein CCR75_004591 [Bremia lactucae]
MPAATPRRRERVSVVYKSVHLVGVMVLTLASMDPSIVVRTVRWFLFLYFALSSLDFVLTRYHLWKFEPTIPQPKRYALITGASSGIGREMSYLLSEQKYSLVLAARSGTVLDRMRAEMELVNRPTEVLVCVCDLATIEGINKLIRYVKNEGLIIDILINNAGASLSKDFMELLEQEIDELMTLDMQALVKLTRSIVPQMVERRIGRVLNISSIAGAAVVPTAALYGSSKAFVTSFSQALSYELRSTGVTVTCICPGPVHTNFSKVAKMDGALCMKVPGMTVDAKDTAKVALDAMFNGEILVYDTWFAFLAANLVQMVIPGRLAAFIAGACMNELKNFWNLLKR